MVFLSSCLIYRGVYSYESLLAQAQVQAQAQATDAYRLQVTLNSLLHT